MVFLQKSCVDSIRNKYFLLLIAMLGLCYSGGTRASIHEATNDYSERAQYPTIQIANPD
tara:strand:+ start:218 stop:394 length:177 start_codon:yes stop_codon:yes gene_type:complete